VPHNFFEQDLRILATGLKVPKKIDLLQNLLIQEGFSFEKLELSVSAQGFAEASKSEALMRSILVELPRKRKTIRCGSVYNFHTNEHRTSTASRVNWRQEVIYGNQESRIMTLLRLVETK